MPFSVIAWYTSRQFDCALMKGTTRVVVGFDTTAVAAAIVVIMCSYYNHIIGVVTNNIQFYVTILVG